MKVNFPDHVWGRLATIAEKREMSVADLLVESAEDLLGAPRRERKQVRPIDLSSLADLHAKGMTDSQIARALDASRAVSVTGASNWAFRT